MRGARGARLSFVAGASLSVYSAQMLSLLANEGAMRWVSPPELSSATLADIVRAAPVGVETEVLAHGRLPLAYSARCFTARHHNLQKDACEYRCLGIADGLDLKTRGTLLDPASANEGGANESVVENNIENSIDAFEDDDRDGDDDDDDDGSDDDDGTLDQGPGDN